MSTFRTRAAVVVTCLLAPMTSLVACGSGSAPSDFCKSVDSLDSVVSSVDQSAEAKSSVAAIKTSLDQIDERVANLSDNAESDYDSQIKAVEKDGAALDSAVAAAATSPTPANGNAARVAFRDLTASVDDLAKATSSSC